MTLVCRVGVRKWIGTHMAIINKHKSSVCNQIKLKLKCDKGESTTDWLNKARSDLVDDPLLLLFGIDLLRHLLVKLNRLRTNVAGVRFRMEFQ